MFAVLVRHFYFFPIFENTFFYTNLLLVSPRDWQGIPFAIDNFNVRFRQLDKLGEPNHQAVISVVDDYVRSKHPHQYHEIRGPADVNDVYLDSKDEQH